jgi:hypothetical protein
MYYVDAAGSDSNGGTSEGDAWATIQNALDSITRDATNGDQINITGAHSITSPLNLTTYDDASGLPTAGAPLILRGYTTVAEDGTWGDRGGSIDSNGVSLWSSIAFDNLHHISLELFNDGSDQVIDLDNNIHIINCEIYNDGIANNVGGVELDDGCTIVGNYFHDIGDLNAAMVSCAGGCLVMFNTFIANVNQTTTDPAQAIVTLSTINSYIMFNVIRMNRSGDNANGISFRGAFAGWNSIWSNGGTGAGIKGQSIAYDHHGAINNLISGFSGSGGAGIDLSAAAFQGAIQFGNSEFDSADPFDDNTNNVSGEPNYYEPGENLSAEPFTAVTGGTAVDATTHDFTPVDTGSVKEGSVPGVFGGV